MAHFRDSGKTILDNSSIAKFPRQAFKFANVGAKHWAFPRPRVVRGDFDVACLGKPPREVMPLLHR